MAEAVIISHLHDAFSAPQVPISVERRAPGLGATRASSTLIDVISHAANRYPLHELSFITSSAHDSSVQTKTFGSFNQSVRNLARALVELHKPQGSIILVYLTEHEDNMTAVWACLLAGYVPCLQPLLSSQESHKEGHIVHITKVTGSVTWLTSETGADEVKSIPGLEIHLLSELRVAAEAYSVPEDWVARTVRPDDEAIFFLTSGSTGFSKVVVHTHRTILSACKSKGTAYGLTSKTNVLNWVGFDHVAGSLEMHVTPLLFGASQVHAHASVILSDPLQFLRLIEDKSINFTFAPNFLLAKLAHDLEKQTDLFGTFELSSLKRINSGGEAVVSSTAKAFSTTLKKLTRDPSKLSFVIAPGFGMTETCAGCVHNAIDVFISEPKFEFLELGTPNPGCEMRIVNPEDGVTLRPDGESGELQLRGPMLFVEYYNNAKATESSFMQGGWYRTGDIGIIEHGSLRLTGRIKDTVVVHGVSHGILELETHLQTVEGVTPSSVVAAPYREPGQQTEGLIIFYSPTFDLYGMDAFTKLTSTHRSLRDILVKMITLPPQHIVPIPTHEMERTTLGKLSRSRLVARFEQGDFAKHVSRAQELLREVRGAPSVAPTSKVEQGLAGIYANILGADVGNVSATGNFFELGGTSIDLLRLKKEGEAVFGVGNIPTTQILKQPTLSHLASYIDTLRSNGLKVEDYDPIVTLNASGNKTPIFMVHPGVGEILVFVDLAKYFHDERPFYALRARGVKPGQPCFTSMDEMITTYTAAVKRTQPYGPYAIAGYSNGGVIAFEIAKRLEGMGDEVKFTGIVDVAPDVARDLNEMDETTVILTMSVFFNLITQEQASEVAPSLRPLSRKEKLDNILKSSHPERLAELNMTHDTFNHWLVLVESIGDCLKQQKPSGSVSAVDVFYAKPFHETMGYWLNKKLKGWKAFSSEEPTFTDVPGSHHTMINSDHVAIFQKAFKNRLEARGL